MTDQFKQAVSVLLQAAEIGQARGAFNLQTAATIFAAAATVKQELDIPEPAKEEVKEEEKED